MKETLSNVKLHFTEVVLVLFYTSSIAIGGIVGALLSYYLLYTAAWPLVIAYYIFFYVEWNTCHQGGRKSTWFVLLPYWKYFSGYFPTSLKKTVNLPPDRNYLFCLFPHGIYAVGLVGNFANNAKFKEVFPELDVHCVLHYKLFIYPFYRDMYLAGGGVASSKESIQYILNNPAKNKALVLSVGGTQEMLYSHTGTFSIVLKNRMGFVRMALLSGAALVPVFSFGETDLYHQVSNPPDSLLFKCQNFIRKYITIKAPCLITHLIPRKCPVTSVVGSPIEVPKMDNPSTEDIKKYHEIFIKELVTLFETHKYNYVENPEEAQLVLV